MFRVIRSQDAIVRQVTENKVARNFVTKEFSPGVSLATIENEGHFGEITAEHNRIYYILYGTLILTFNDEVIELHEGDTCFIEGGTTYDLNGDCKLVTVDQPAFGT